jgi:omega-amidase
MQLLTVTVIQAELAWENKEKNLRRLEEKIKAIDEPTELVILPEMFSTGFSMNTGSLAESMEEGSVLWMQRVAAENKIILTGSLIIKDGENFYNRLIWMLPNGQYGFYDKRHLFGYGRETEFYKPGNKRLIASAKGWKINLQVCYDLRFPVWARNKTTGGVPEYDLLIYVANWPTRRSHAWKTLLCARAIENQCYVVGVNRVGTDGNDLSYSGNSMVIDPLGEVLYHKEETEDIFTITLDKDHLNGIREKLPFLKDGDDFSFTG